MLSSHFKDDMMKYPSYDAYIREYVGFHYLVEHFRLSCWRTAVLSPGSGYSIPHRTSTQNISETQQLEVAKATFERYYNCNDPKAHPGQLDRAPRAASISTPGDPLHTVHTKHGALISQACIDEFSNILDKHKDFGGSFDGTQKT